MATLTEEQKKILESGKPVSDAPAFSEEMVSPTVITNATAIEETIPDLNQRLSKLRETAEGIKKSADELAAEEQAQPEVTLEKVGKNSTGLDLFLDSESGLIETAEERNTRLAAPATTAPISDTDKESQTRINEMKKSLDEQTKASIASIESQFKFKRQQLNEINRRAEESRAQSLLLGGSSRYAQLSATGIFEQQQTNSLLAIAELDAEEKKLISSALAAQGDGNFKLMEKELDLAEKKRAEKQKEADKIATSQAKEAEEIKKTKRLQNIELGTAELFEGGIESPIDIQTFLKSKGIESTLKEIEDTLKIINPDPNLTGVSADFKTFKQFFPNTDVSTPDGRKLFIDWSTAVGNANRKAEEPKPVKGGVIGGVDVQDVTLNAFAGLDPQTPSDKAALQTDIRNLGLNEEEPPQWFKEQAEQQLQATITPEKLKELWDEERQPVLDMLKDKGETPSSGREP